MCLYPKLIENRKYKPNKKNGGIIPPITDDRVLYVAVGCGKCIECMQQKKREWLVRLQEEIKENNNGKFVTLTFRDEELDKLQNEIDTNDYYIKSNESATLAVRRFLERWRKKYKKSVRHWLVTELGQNNSERVHLHGILWTDVDNDTIQDLWKYGNIWVGTYVNARTINYIVKYIHKQDLEHKNYKPKILCSKGIGSRYLKTTNINRNKFKDKETNTLYKNAQGYEMALPIYYRNHIYTEEEREKLWINMLDKEERWVCGERIDISESEEEYFKLRDYYREKNKRLGYGDDTENFDEKQYKDLRRKFRILKKLKKEINDKHTRYS
jgi:hypothetical protein